MLPKDNKPVCYASRVFSGAGTRYAPIEVFKNACSVFACRKFQEYICGRSVVVETYHKPFQAIRTKPLSQVSLSFRKWISMCLAMIWRFVNLLGINKSLETPRAEHLYRMPTVKLTEKFHEINMVLSVLKERCEEFQKDTKVNQELTSSSHHGDKWMARARYEAAEASPCCSFRYEIRNSRWSPLRRNTLICPKGRET